MGRKWIMVELGDHCHTHIQPRLQKVCDGTDQGGVSKAVNWQGGGGFKYYYMAPSLLKKDRYDQWIINEEYNAPMLAAAMAAFQLLAADFSNFAWACCNQGANVHRPGAI